MNQRMFEAVLNVKVDTEHYFDSNENDDPDKVILMSNDECFFECSRKIMAYQSDLLNKAVSGHDWTSKEGDMLAGLYYKFETCNNVFLEAKSVIILDDVDGKTLTEILRYIYTEKCIDKNLDECVLNCLYAAEKYF